MTRTDSAAFATALSLVLVVVAFGACNGSFDFDTELDVAADAAAADAGRAFVGKIECDTQTCDATTQHCCVDSTGPHCVEVLAACAGLSIPCDDPSDCPPGNGCCSEAREGQIAQVECEEPTSCLSKGHVLLCSPGDPGACSSGICLPAAQAPLPPGYHQCN